MEFDALLRAHAFMRVERPPELWEADTALERFLPMLGEMIAIGLGRGNELADLSLNVSNVTALPDEEDERVPTGDHVAVTIAGSGSWSDDVWHAGEGPTRGLLANLAPRADDAGAAFAYTRDLGAEGGAVTVFLPRLRPPDLA